MKESRYHPMMPNAWQFIFLVIVMFGMFCGTCLHCHRQSIDHAMSREKLVGQCIERSNSPFQCRLAYADEISQRERELYYYEPCRN